jgi:hypothetical protein
VGQIQDKAYPLFFGLFFLVREYELPAKALQFENGKEDGFERR